MEKIMVRTRTGQFQSLVIGLGEESLQYVAQSHNEKTGKLPAQFIGASREESESTCRICPLWKEDTCYAQDGSVQLGHAAILRFVRGGGKRDLDQALENAHEEARYVRMAAIGDPGSIAPEVYQDHEQRMREWGFGVLSYTHHWFLPHAQHLKGHALASADTMKDAVDAAAEGWRVAMHVDEDAPVFDGQSVSQKPQGTLKNGIKYFLCPAQRTENAITCGDCGLCDGQKETKYNTIVFIEHGQQIKFKKQREARAAQAQADQALADTATTYPTPTPLPEPIQPVLNGVKGTTRMMTVKVAQ